MLLAGCTSPNPDGGTTGGGTDELDGGSDLPPLADPLSADELTEYGGVARLLSASDCTATLIDTGVDSGPAYLVTNGHCIGLDSDPANTTLVDQEGFGDALFFAVAGALDQAHSVPVERFEYGTMRGTDVAIVRLAATLGDLRAAGAVPLPIASEAPEAGGAVVNIAAPTQGVSEREWVLRKGECTLGETTDVVEFRWLWTGSIANDCPGVRGGSSGSPLIAHGEVVSIVNTTNAGLAPDRIIRCYLGQPCTVDGDDVRFTPDTSYGVRVAGLDACFVDGTFDLDADGCPLEVLPADWSVGGGGFFGPDGTDGGGFTPELTLQLSSGSSGDSGSSDGSGAQTAPAPATDLLIPTDVPIGDGVRCSDPSAYADAQRVSVASDGDAVTVPVTLPSTDGFVLACVAAPGQEARSARFVFSVDSRPPVAPPALTTLVGGGDDTEDDVVVDPLFDVPEISDILFTWGDPATTDCADLASYRPYFRIFISIPRDELPVRFCTYGRDVAGNASPVGQYTVGTDGAVTRESP